MSSPKFDRTKGILSFRLRPEETEEVDLPTDVDQRNFSDPAGFIPPKDHGCFIKSITLHNVGAGPIFRCYLDVEDRDWRSPESLLGKTAGARDSERLVKELFCWWKDHIYTADRDVATPQLFFLCQGQGTAEAQATAFTDLLLKHNIAARLAPLNGHTAYEYFYGGQWHLVDPARNAAYLRLDNKSIASAQELIDDPFLIQRTHCFGKYRSMDISRSWRNASQLQYQHARYNAAVERSFPEVQRGFDIYPGEEVSFHCQDSSTLAAIRQGIQISQRRQGDGSLLVHSLFPIRQVTNTSEKLLVLVDEGIHLDPGQSCDLSAQVIFNLRLESAAESGEILIECEAARLALPSLRAGRQQLRLLGEGGEEAQVEVSYAINTELLQRPVPALDVVSIGNVFDHSLPSFEVQARQEGVERLWWQITRADEGMPIVSNLDQVIPFTGHVSLDRLADSFLSSDVEYHFHVRGYAKGVWGEWSIPFPFRVIKPEPVGQVCFVKRRHARYEISWEPSSSPNVNYHVFGSNALDAIPDIYHGEMVNKILGNEVTEAAEDDNHVITINDCSITVNGDLAYYRIIAESRGHYSLPSPLIRVYDNELLQERSVLRGTVDGTGQFSAERITLQGAPRPLDGVAATEEEQNLVIPFLFPINHPCFARVNRLFHSGRIVETPDSWYSMGFHDVFQGLPSPELVVGQHPELPGIRIKAYFDVPPSGTNAAQLDPCQELMDRVRGATFLRQELKERKYRYLDVPQTWLYVMPTQAALPNSEQAPRPNPCVLIVEAPKLLSSEANLEAYRTAMTPAMLDGLVRIISLGVPHLSPDSLRFCEDGTLMFVDTAKCLQGKWAANYDDILPYLSPSNAEYWKKIVRRERNRAGVYSGLIEREMQLESTAPLQEGFYDDERLRISYVGRQVFDLPSARRFVIRTVHQLLEAVNVDNDSDPYLQGYLFTPVNIGVEMSFKDLKGDFVGEGQMAMVMLVKGTIYYDIYRETDGLVSIHEESYEEAIEKVKAGHD